MDGGAAHITRDSAAGATLGCLTLLGQGGRGTAHADRPPAIGAAKRAAPKPQSEISQWSPQRAKGSSPFPGHVGGQHGTRREVVVCQPLPCAPVRRGAHSLRPTRRDMYMQLVEERTEKHCSCNILIQ